MRNVKTYYRHARSLGPFHADDCLRMARQAALLDVRAPMTIEDDAFYRIHYCIAEGGQVNHLLVKTTPGKGFQQITDAVSCLQDEGFRILRFAKAT